MCTHVEVRDQLREVVSFLLLSEPKQLHWTILLSHPCLWDRSLTRTWSLPSVLDWQSCAGISNRSHYACFLCGCWGSGLSLHAYGKHFIKQAISEWFVRSPPEYTVWVYATIQYLIKLSYYVIHKADFCLRAFGLATPSNNSFRRWSQSSLLLKSLLKYHYLRAAFPG